MVKIKQNIKVLSKQERLDVHRLNEELDILFIRLSDEPSNTNLYREIRETEIKIIDLTGEKTLEY